MILKKPILFPQKKTSNDLDELQPELHVHCFDVVFGARVGQNWAELTSWPGIQTSNDSIQGF